MNWETVAYGLRLSGLSLVVMGGGGLAIGFMYVLVTQASLGVSLLVTFLVGLGLYWIGLMMDLDIEMDHE